MTIGGSTTNSCRRRRCREMAEVATPAAARFPLAIKELLQQGLSLRDRYLEQTISLHGLWTATGRLEVKLDRLLERSYREPANRRLAQHLRHERPYLFTEPLAKLKHEGLFLF